GLVCACYLARAGLDVVVLEAAANLVEAADLVLTTHAAQLPGHLAARARRVVKVGWALEPGGLTGWRMSAEPSRGAG
ncbi:MAG TPA: hypothetical protein VFW32_08390, partial [Actinomycetes bacterium]|nr:hypothetical protein [Actinomycetes bacterium]